MYALPMESWLRLAVWLALGLVIYFIYGRHNSKLQHGQMVLPRDPVDPLNPK
jgi:APA family basic amino acid/polyamine antiporter